MSYGYYRLGSNVKGKKLPSIGLGHEIPLEHVAEAQAMLNAAEVPPEAVEVDTVNSPLPPQAMGYTGDTCAVCNSTRMLRTGHCSTCQDCGSTTDCA